MISFNKHYIAKNQNEYINDCFERNKISGDGYYTKKATQFLEQRFNIGKALLTTSCSTALDISAILIDLKEGDEVIMPSYTFVSTANAVVLRGAKPIFAEIDEQTLNINVNDIENKITKRTKAIFTVHYAGVSCDMDKVSEIANKNKLFVIEDAAQGVNAKYKDRYLGAIGDIGCYSFHETKNYSCGEGGALLINRNEEFSDRAEIIREKGTNRSKFFRGEVDKYSWVDIGSSYLMSDILSATLYSQFEELDFINHSRKNIYEQYFNELKILEDKGIIKLPVIPKYSTSNYHMFYILLNSENERDYLMNELRKRGIYAVFHYVPLHNSKMGNKLGYSQGDLPVTENLSSRILRLPMYVELNHREIHYIIESIYNILT